MTLGILLLGNLKMEIYSVYMEVGIIVKLTILSLKLGNSEFGSLIIKKTAFNLSFKSLRSLFLYSFSLKDS